MIQMLLENVLRKTTKKKKMQNRRAKRENGQDLGGRNPFFTRALHSKNGGF